MPRRQSRSRSCALQYLDSAGGGVLELRGHRVADGSVLLQGPQGPVDDVGVRQHGAEEHRPVAVQHQQRRQRLDVDVAEPLAVVLDVQPDVDGIVALPGRSEKLELAQPASGAG